MDGAVIMIISVPITMSFIYGYLFVKSEKRRKKRKYK